MRLRDSHGGDHKKCSEQMLQIRIRIVLKTEQSKFLLYGSVTLISVQYEMV